MVWSPEKTFELEAGSTNIAFNLDQLQGTRDKTLTRKTWIADSITATCIQEHSINSNCHFYLNQRSELTRFCNCPIQRAAHINREVRMVLWQQNKLELKLNVLPRFLFFQIEFQSHSGL